MATPIIEEVLVARLTTQYPQPTYRVCTELPAKLAQVLPVIQVGGIGGQGLQIAVGRPNVDFDVYAEDRESARTLAHEVWDWLLFSLPGTGGDGSWISQVEPINSPNWAPYDNTSLRRFTSTAQIYCRALPTGD